MPDFQSTLILTDRFLLTVILCLKNLANAPNLSSRQSAATRELLFILAGRLDADRPCPYPCDRSHEYHHFQRSHNSLALRQVLSFSENNGTHKRALIDRKGMRRVYLNYCGSGVNLILLTVIPVTNIAVISASTLISSRQNAPNLSSSRQAFFALPRMAGLDAIRQEILRLRSE
jgi:hypothetical protein